ncbi:DNA glycosylase superfamily protein [Striga asiatica]|uniref:DNA glycosylase superfamily protein n=1 Tax=Striga asiatica TaxID=4170 RepID=A0A5A7Q4Z6_STRAF|nr:DNA glycosylase superfamily protein [Striga asiatica]
MSSATRMPPERLPPLSRRPPRSTRGTCRRHDRRRSPPCTRGTSSSSPGGGGAPRRILPPHHLLPLPRLLRNPDRNLNRNSKLARSFASYAGGDACFRRLIFCPFLSFY